MGADLADELETKVSAFGRWLLQAVLKRRQLRHRQTVTSRALASSLRFRKTLVTETFRVRSTN